MLQQPNDNGKEKERPWLVPTQFKPGQVANPAGRPRGSRNKLSDDFLRDAYAEWQQSGPTALKAMAANEPSKFCQMVASLLPKESVFQDERVQISEIKLVVINQPENDQLKTLDINPVEISTRSGAVSPPAKQLDAIAQVEHKPIAHSEHKPIKAST